MFFRWIKNIIIFGFIFCLLIIIVFRFFSQKYKDINFQFFMVQSGSMEPSINIGDILLVVPYPDYVVNDVITFKDEINRIVTHRIVNIVDEKFTTKGDANRAEDNALVSKKNVVGKTVLVVPKLGYLVDFSKSQIGLLVFVIFPGLILIITQLWHFRK